MSQMDLHFHMRGTSRVSKIITHGSIYSHHSQNTCCTYTGLFHMRRSIVAYKSTPLSN